MGHAQIAYAVSSGHANIDTLDLATGSAWDAPTEPNGLCYIGNGFATGDIDGNIYKITLGGVVTTSGFSGWDYKGLSPIGGGLGAQVCAANVNSTGFAADIFAGGSDVAASGNFLELGSFPVPNQFGIFFTGPGLIDIPFGNGHLCAGGGITRLSGPTMPGGNLATLDVENTYYAPGTTGYFQYWFRDPAAGGAAFNTSYALEVRFL